MVCRGCASETGSLQRVPGLGMCTSLLGPRPGNARTSLVRAVDHVGMGESGLAVGIRLGQDNMGRTDEPTGDDLSSPNLSGQFSPRYPSWLLLHKNVHITYSVCGSICVHTCMPTHHDLMCQSWILWSSRGLVGMGYGVPLSIV